MSEDGKRKPAVDLDRMSVPELIAHIATAQAMLREKQEATKAALLAKWRAEAAENDLPFESLLAAPHAAPGRKRRVAGEKLPVKFRGPNGEEWSGRGRLPNWLAALEATGRKRDEFRIS